VWAWTVCPALTVSLHFVTTCATRVDCLVCAGDFSIDALKKEAESLMIPGEKWPDYIGAQILRFKEEELKLERKEAEKQLELERKEAEKQLERKEAAEKHELERKEAEKQLERKEAEKQLELEGIKMNITKTGLLWKLKTQTQRHGLELFLFDCWERMQRFSEDEITQIRLKNKRFPLVPAKTIVSAAICVVSHLSLCFQRS